MLIKDKLYEWAANNYNYFIWLEMIYQYDFKEYNCFGSVLGIEIFI
jgi:hypothetical protein